MLTVETNAGLLRHGDRSYPCVIGKHGACPSRLKSEGDGCTPLGAWPLRGALIRPDRVTAPIKTGLPWRYIRPADGWSDTVTDPAYNRPVRHPHGFGAEHLWRADGAYDIVIVLGHNDAPPIPGGGSAIFFHLSVTDGKGALGPTEGCVAVPRETMLALLPVLDCETIMRIV